ncbi:unnamed protein product [Symbiodinium natans]|uniref:Sphingomyelin synthase-like domain-containing protein n=1 Tax=Symbiodinium natans TaxID=878477 RepID=A0A812PZC9_9DINO|nr:unnamed protein product [Symbiodinium natans]
MWLQLFLWGRVGHACIRIVQSQSHFSVDLVVALIFATLLWNVLEMPRAKPKEASRLPKPWVRGELLVWSSGLIASLAVLAALLTSSAAGPLSEANRSRLREISAAPTSRGNVPRLFCAMMHIERSYQARRGYAEAAEKTWARHCDGHILWDENTAAIAAQDAASALEDPPVDFRPAPAGVAFRWLRTRRLVRYLRRHAAGYDWFLVFDDGGFPIAENILLLTGRFSGDEVEAMPILLSDRNRPGAFGALFNQAALHALVASFDDPRGDCLAPTREEPLRTLQAMSALWRCGSALRRAGWDAEESLRNVLGCEDGDESLVNLKVRPAGGVCRHALMAYMVPEPSWMADIHEAVYG